MEKKFNWKWSEKHWEWELQEIPLKAEKRIGNLKIGEIGKKSETIFSPRHGLKSIGNLI